MNTICVPTSGRVGYLEKFLASLQANDLTGWRLLLHQEPVCAYDSKEIIDLLLSMGLPVLRAINPHPLGPDANFYAGARDAFGAPDTDAVVHFDDDMVLSPDAIALCNWYLSLTHHPADAGLCLCNEKSDDSYPYAVSSSSTQQGLVGQGYCFTRAQWNNFVQPVETNMVPGRSYDWSTAVRAVEQERVILRPLLSRTQHIGLIGTHGAAAGVHTKVFPDLIATQQNGDYYII